jgi:hypothetical protein
MSLTLTQLAEKVVGLRCIDVSNPLGSALRLVFDATEAASARSWRVVLEDGWRWTRGADVLADSETPGGRDGELRTVVAPLRSRSVIGVVADDRTGALQFRLDDGSVLATLADDANAEWVLVAGDGTSARLSRDQGLVFEDENG